MIWLAVAVGGAMGSVGRHGVNVAVTRLFGTTGPYATFFVNVLGSLTIGLLAGLLASNRMEMTTTTRTFVFVGILGGFTTFSSYMLDSLTLADSGRVSQAILNIGGQVIVGYAAAFIGFRIGA